MDDPWGSPWASTDHDYGAPRPLSQLSLGLEPNSPASLGNNTLGIPSLPTQSPWADDDDAFGDWATADASTTIPDYSNALGVPSTGVSEAGKTKPVSRQPSTTSLSLKIPLSPNDPSKPTVTSPPFELPHDHWSADSTLPEEEHSFTSDLILSSGREASLEQFGDQKAGFEPAQTHEQTPPSDDIVHTSDEKQAADGIHGHNVKDETEPPQTGTEPFHANDSTTPSSPSSPVDIDDSSERKNPSGTTTDDDSTTEPLGTRNKAPSEKNKSASLHDGLTIAAKEQPNGETEAENPETDLCELEQHGDEEVMHVLSGPESEVPRTPTSDRNSNGDMLSPRTPGSSAARTAELKAAALRSPSATAPSVGKVDLIRSSVDQHQIDKLFDIETPSRRDTTGGKDDADSTETLDSYVSDEVISDSFTTISERKAWYRISRQGSSRKHDAADDDNYRPISWSASTVRVETIQIVRRWMEEDSFLGKPTLGGNGGGANVFGWNSAAKPVALNEIFKRKSMEPRPLSSGSYLSASSAADSTGTTDKTPLSPVSMFTWSSTFTPAAVSGSSPRVAHPSKFDRPKTTTPSSIAPPRFPPFSPGIPPPAASVSQNGIPQGEALSESLRANDEEDDDEWGDMVSSPAKGPHEFPDAAATACFPGSPRQVEDGGSSALNNKNECMDSVAEGDGSSRPKTVQHKVLSSPTPPPTSAMSQEQQEVLIQNILLGLPDLSYMSR